MSVGCEWTAMHGICSRRLVHKERVEVGSNYKNLAYGGYAGSNRIEKGQSRVSARQV